MDSLTNRLAHYQHKDSAYVILLNQIAFEQHFDQPKEAASHALEAFAIADKISYAKGKAVSYRCLGLTFWAQANLSAALTYFVKGLKIADSIGSRQIQADITGNIGLVYSGMGNSAKALKYFETSVLMQHGLKNHLREAAMLNNVGDCYYKMRKYDSALATYRKALEMGRSKKFGLATNLRNIGNVYEATGELDVALSYYYKAKVISDSLSDNRGMTQVRNAIGSIFLKKKQYGIAARYARECLDIAGKANLKAVIRDSYELLSKIAEAQGLMNQSLHYFKLFTAYKDSIQNLSESSKISSLQLEYETHRKQLEIDVLKRDSQLKDVLLISAGVGIFLISVFLVNAVRNSRRQKLRNIEILALSEKIQAQQEEVTLQRDILSEKNMKIESLHKQLTEINEKLENRVTVRTAALKEQNKHLEEYAFITAHRLRAPAARILGIVNLMKKEHSLAEQNILFEYLIKSTIELDQIIHSISHTLQQGMRAYDDQNLES
ncbi:MAG TPA: tetratricopeptide repeat protein [Cyclobacteriaceae bacterium]|nr:tetratricopeptide repeat protein [Cyclobacteriaceae bacterium]